MTVDSRSAATIPPNAAKSRVIERSILGVRQGRLLAWCLPPRSTTAATSGGVSHGEVRSGNEERPYVRTRTDGSNTPAGRTGPTVSRETHEAVGPPRWM